jgi:hypothetical protein
MSRTEITALCVACLAAGMLIGAISLLAAFSHLAGRCEP